jgi:hypothetical protein
MKINEKVNLHICASATWQMSVNGPGLLSDFLQAGHLCSPSTRGTSDTLPQEEPMGLTSDDLACPPCSTLWTRVSETALQLAENSELSLSSTPRQLFPYETETIS